MDALWIKGWRLDSIDACAPFSVNCYCSSMYIDAMVISSWVGIGIIVYKILPIIYYNDELFVFIQSGLLLEDLISNFIGLVLEAWSLIPLYCKSTMLTVISISLLL